MVRYFWALLQSLAVLASSRVYSIVFRRRRIFNSSLTGGFGE